MISVIVPTWNPHPGRLQRTLAGLKNQSLAREEWELIVVDNGSAQPFAPQAQTLLSDLAARIVVEPRPGLTFARIAGLHTASGDVVVFVDDDNVLSADYLAQAARRFRESAGLGAAGGPVTPEWEVSPPAWTGEFHGLLALRDLGPSSQIARGDSGATWPVFAPVGAGLAVRRTHALQYVDAVERDPRRRTLDRAGNSLASGGDNDLVFTVLHAGGDVAYFPELRLQHLIPASRLEVNYLVPLNRGIMRSWVRVLALHGHCPWRPIARWTVPFRATRAWLRRRAWTSSAARVRWAGDLGQFEGQADISRGNES